MLAEYRSVIWFHTPEQKTISEEVTAEIQKKHDDKSYRYFNEMNRLAKKFPIAHTADPKHEVEVWCANDYLGMGNNPIVLETMQYVTLLSCSHVKFEF